MKRSLLFLLTFIFVFRASAQDSAVQNYGNKISRDELKEYLTIIASDALEGRETGSRGQKMAAAFISAHFQEIGLKAPVNGSYYQPVDLYSNSFDAYVKAGQTRFDNYSHIAYYGSADTEGEVTLPVIFAGYASEADFNQVDVKDKAVLFLEDEARISGSNTVALARENGATMILVCNTKSVKDFEEMASQIKNFRSEEKLSLEKPTASNNPGLFVLSPVAVEKIMGTTMEKLRSAAKEDPSKKALKKIKPSSIQYATTNKVKITRSDNVLGLLEGADKKDEVIVITAHYDHIGKKDSGRGDLINNGADDDGSGTVAVMELAKVFAQAKKEGKGPRRSILFMTVTGEESGLLGSEYYTENPVYPLTNTVVNLNIDMIGRRDAKHEDSHPYLYIIGSDKLSTDLHAVNEAANKTYSKLVFDYTYNDDRHPERLYYRSDHWNFAQKNIPVIFYFSGLHEDYHKVTDEVSKIEFDLLERRTQCIFYTAWEIANRDVRITADADKLNK